MIYIIKKIKIKFKILYLKIKHRLDNADIQVLRLPEIPYRGICPICKEKVYHAYPWFTRNHERYPDAKPLELSRKLSQHIVVADVSIPNMLYETRIETLNTLKIKAFETTNFISEKAHYIKVAMQSILDGDKWQIRLKHSY